jgi:hypothetical protein
MGFEDPKFISEFVVLNPEDTDQRAQGALTMRAIKNAIVGTGTDTAGSFTPNATGQYTGTMDEIQFATDNAIPTDMTTTPPVAGDSLTYDGTDWVPGTPAALEWYQGTANGYAGQNGNLLYFTNDADDIPASVATIVNDANGWTLTAVSACVLNIGVAWQANNVVVNEIQAGTAYIMLDGITTLTRGVVSMGAQNLNGSASVSAQAFTNLTPGQTITLERTGGQDIVELYMTLILKQNG